MKLTRPEPLRFERHDGSVIVAPPATRGQMREVYALDRDVQDLAERRGKAVAILLRDACTVAAGGVQQPFQDLDSLTAEEEQDVIHAFIASHHGYRPDNAVALQLAMRELLKKKLTDTQPKN